MCEVTNTPPALACQVGDLKPGQQFHDPNGETWMVLGMPDGLDNYDAEEDTLVVNLGNGPGNRFGNALTNNEFKGRVTPVRNNLKLGYDHKGTLYTSTYLNGWYDPTPAPQVALTPLNDDDDDLPGLPADDGADLSIEGGHADTATIDARLNDLLSGFLGG